MTLFETGHALLIGVGGDLPNTIDDATGLAALLRDSERSAYPPSQVHLLTGEQATRTAILSTLAQLVEAGPEATVVVYFSGHGYRVATPIDEAYYLMPYGYDVRRLYQTAVSGIEFAARLQALDVHKLLVLLDCCHAGGVGEGKSPDLAFIKAPLPPEAQALLATGRGRVVIASSRADELSYAGRPYSAFTLALIEALCGMGVARRDGFVRVGDLALHARQVVPGRTGGRQHPILHFEQADNFALAYYAGGAPDPKELPFAALPEIEPEPGAWRAGRITNQSAVGEGNVQVQLEGVSRSPISINLGARPERASPRCPACGETSPPGGRFCSR